MKKLFKIFNNMLRWHLLNEIFNFFIIIQNIEVCLEQLVHVHKFISPSINGSNHLFKYRQHRFIVTPFTIYVTICTIEYYFDIVKIHQEKYDIFRSYVCLCYRPFRPCFITHILFQDTQESVNKNKFKFQKCIYIL